MNVMDLGNMKKKKKSVEPTSQLAKSNIIDHSFTNGKSRVQGSQGATQGNQGWKSQHTPTDGDYGKQINPIIQSITSKTKYETPQIKDSLLTNKGFNQALGVIGAKNKAKIDMQNKRALQGTLGSLISGDSQNRAMKSREMIASMGDKTKRRGQDYNYASDASNRSSREDIAEMNNETRQRPKQTNPMDDRIKRQKIAKEGGLEGIIGSEQYQNLSDEQQQDIAGRYIMTGELPTLNTGEEGIVFDGNPTVNYGENANSVHKPTQEVQNKATGFLFENISKGLGIERGLLKLSDDGNRVILPDGREAPLSLLSERFGG